MRSRERARSVQEHLDRAPVRGGRFRTGLFHFILRASWGQLLLAYVALYLLANALFAAGYLLTGGVANARPGSFADAFWFSVQILGTGGDSSMSSVGLGAHLLVVLETMLAVLLIAVAGGVTFARFSVPGQRVRFSVPAVVFLFDGVPTLAFRVANQRRELVAAVDVAIVAERRELTSEGYEIWRGHDLPLVRSHHPTLARGFTVMHSLDARSPWHGYTPERLVEEGWEIEASLTGTDSISGQLVHASAVWPARDLRWGYRLADTIIAVPGGSAIVDLSRFDATVPCTPTADFPYPRDGDG